MLRSTVMLCLCWIAPHLDVDLSGKYVVQANHDSTTTGWVSLQRLPGYTVYPEYSVMWFNRDGDATHVQRGCDLGETFLLKYVTSLEWDCTYRREDDILKGKHAYINLRSKLKE